MFLLKIFITGDLPDKKSSQTPKQVRRKVGGDQILACKQILAGQLCKSSVQQQADTTWYDNKGESSDSVEHNTHDRSNTWSYTREKMQSFGKGTKKHSKALYRKGKDMFEIVSDLQGKQTIKDAWQMMGCSVSSAEEAFPDEDERIKREAIVTKDSPKEVSRMRVKALVESFEQLDNEHELKNISLNDTSSRSSTISSNSSSTESFEDQLGDKNKVYPEDQTDESRHEKKAYLIAKEIMSSEKVFVEVIQLVNVRFRQFAEKKIKGSFLEVIPQDEFNKLFSNLPEMMMFSEQLLNDFEERVNNWESHKKIADVIMKKGPFLRLFTIYIRDFSTMTSHFDECLTKYPSFKQIVEDFESLSECQNLKLKHYMLKPVQRLPQYRLLLEDYIKHISSESEEFDDTTRALKVVNDVADSANDSVRKEVIDGFNVELPKFHGFPG